MVVIHEKPLAATIERDVIPETLEIDGATHVRLADHSESAGEEPSGLRAESLAPGGSASSGGRSD